MPLETVDQRPPSAAAAAARLYHPPEPENYPCPRCDSTNTKFCYYNNYNLSQPRHFCKSCRRYWTRGGTLRNVPFGGATRKNPLKRSRSSAPLAASAVPDNNNNNNSNFSPPAPKLDDAAAAAAAASFYSDVGMNGNYPYDPVPTIPGTFTSLLVPNGGSGGLFGYGLESGLREMEFGLSIGVWPIEEIDGGGGGAVVGCGDSAAAWEMGGGEERGLTDSECLDWPELAISTPERKTMK